MDYKELAARPSFVLEKMVASLEIDAAVKYVNELSREETNALSVRFVALLLAANLVKEARRVISVLFADESFRIMNRLLVADHTGKIGDIFALKVIVEGYSRNKFVLEKSVHIRAAEVISWLASASAEEGEEVVDEAVE